MSERNSDPSPSAEALLEVARALAPARLLLTAAEYDLFSHVERSADTAPALAAAVGTHPRATEQVLNGLAASGLLLKVDGRYRNTEAARRFLTADSPENILARLAFQRLLWERWSHLSDALRSGQVDSLPPVMERPEPELRRFLDALDHFGRQQAPRVAAAAGLHRARRLLDLGGGVGTYALEFARQYPDMCAVVWDLPQVAPLATETIAAAGLQHRVTARAGDFFPDPLLLPGEDPYDAILLSNVLHLHPPEKNRALLHRLKEVLAPTGRLLIHDVLMDEDGVHPAYGTFLSLTMLVMSEGGGTYPESEVRRWLAEVGLDQLIRIQVEEDIALLIAEESGAND